MSLLDSRAPHVVEIQNRVMVTTSRGAKEFQDVGPLVSLRCSVQPVREWSTAEEHLYKGMQVMDLKQIFARRWPGDIHTLVYFRGDVFESVGQPGKRGMSRATAHATVIVRWIKKDDRPDFELSPSFNSPGYYY